MNQDITIKNSECILITNNEEDNTLTIELVPELVEGLRWLAENHPEIAMEHFQRKTHR